MSLDEVEKCLRETSNINKTVREIHAADGRFKLDELFSWFGRVGTYTLFGQQYINGVAVPNAPGR